jgi:hypothetical protein
MTEKYWQEQKLRNERNAGNTHPVIEQTMTDMASLVSRKDPKEYYMNCLQGALNLRQWVRFIILLFRLFLIVLR